MRAEPAALAAGLAVSVAVFLLAGGPIRPRRPEMVARGLAHEARLGDALVAGWGWPGAVAAQAVALAGALAVTWLVTGVPVLGAGTGALAVVSTRIALGRRLGAARRRRQDAVLEAVRLLRGLLEAGGVGVQEGLAVLGERGPALLRQDFSSIAAAASTGRQGAAWAAAQVRLDDPHFDMLAAAVAVQRPSGGALGPLFADLEESVTALHEVVREAEALQAQARAAAALVVALPVGFLLALGAMRSPYLDAYRTLPGGLFLAGALTAIAGGYAWMLAWLRLPPEPRLGSSQ